MDLDKEDLILVLDSLKHSKDKIENYEKYPSPEYKKVRIEEITKVIAKVQALKINIDNS